ncbi:MAG: NUDIX hydrolase [Dehalococcoidia bacterium]
MKHRLEISAGGVIYRRNAGAIDVCLILTQDGKAWQLPKGLIEEGEPAEVAAQREVAEETGLQGELVQPLDKIEYWYVWDGDEEPVRVHKFVHFYLFRYIDGSTEDHDDEVDDAVWLPMPEAEERLSFEGEQRVLRLAAEALERAHA